MENWDLWPVHIFVDSLVAGGVRHVVISPGSRNTPLTLAFVEHPEIRTYTHMDERSAAFFALGIAKATHAPVVVICTSGTATANYYPAVMEAFEARVPLLVVTADRPAELRDVGANQAVRQPGMFANHVKWSVEMPIPDGKKRTALHAASVGARATSVCTSHPMGPVHVNYPFVEPLMLPSRSELTDEHRVPTPVVYSPDVQPASEEACTLLTTALNAAESPLIVLGPNADPLLAQSILTFAVRNRIPVLADVLSQVKFGALDGEVENDPRISYYDLLLSTPGSTVLYPDLVLRFGAQPTSKWLSGFLSKVSESGAEQILFETTGMYRDASFSVSKVIIGSVLDWLDSTQMESAAWAEFFAHWKRVDEIVGNVVQQFIESNWFEGSALTKMVNMLPAGSNLMIGNSRPIRDLDALAVAEQRITTYGNRGVSGIDGIVSTAFGIAAGHQISGNVCRPPRTYLCIGDVSFYHDLNGMLAHLSLGVPLTIVLIHNGGGGIFQHLSQASRTDTLMHFTTPHTLQFDRIVESYGGHYHRAQDADQFVGLLKASATEDNFSVIELTFENDESAKLYKSLNAQIRSAVEGKMI